LSQRRAENSVAMLAISRRMLMETALRTHPSSKWPLSMKRSSRARTRTNTAASAKKELQRWAEMAIRSISGEGVGLGSFPPPEGTRTRRGADGEDVCEDELEDGCGPRGLLE
jgi:hypothetical protein